MTVLDAAVADLLQLVRASSVSGTEEAATRIHRDLLAEAGFTVEVDQWGNVVGRREFGPGPVVLHDAHLDTVEVADPEQWSHDPSGERVGDTLYGRGMVDTKASVVAAVHAARSLVSAGIEVGTLVLVGSVGEELAEGPALRPVLERVRPDVVVIGEPSYGRLVLGQRGRAEIRVEVTGRAGHSAFPDASVNAAEVMADCMVALRGIELPDHDRLGPGLMALTNLVSHPQPSQSTVPPSCLAVYDRRTLPGETADQVVTEVARLLEPIARASGAVVSVSLARSEWDTWTGRPIRDEIFAAAWELSDTTGWVAATLDQFSQQGLDCQALYWGFCTNGSASASAGIPTVGLGAGDPTRAHTADEAIETSELEAAINGYQTLFATLLTHHPQRGATNDI